MDNKEQFVLALKATGRKGVDNVLARLDELGFFKAPASTKFHGSVEGGLLQHSLNVYYEARMIRKIQIQIRPEIANRLTEDSVIIVSLLHDVCKAEIYKEVEKFHKDAYGKWEKYKTYAVDYSAFPLGHGEKSVIQLLRWGMAMTDDEIMAIRWHMSGFDLAFQSPECRSNYGSATEACPLLAVLKAADDLASHILEAK